MRGDAGVVIGDAERVEPAEASVRPVAGCMIPEGPGGPVLTVRPGGSVACQWYDRAGLG